MVEATRRRAAGGLVVVCAAQFVVGVDGLAVAVALPTLQRDLELTTGQVQWVLTAMTSAGVVSGVLLGGLVTEVAGWRWVFLMVVPPALAAALAAPRSSPRDGPRGRPGRPTWSAGCSARPR